MRKSFADAIKGVTVIMKTERNFRIHLAIAFYVLISAAMADVSMTEWLIIFVCIGAVTGSEVLNTAIEKLCDTLHPDKCEGIGLVKDMTAGGVLMFAVMSAVIGGLIFFNEEKVTRFFKFAETHIVLTLLIAATLPITIYLVFRRYGNDQKDRNDHHRRASQRW